MPKRKQKTKRMKIVDTELLNSIEDAVANGATSNRLISNALGWNSSTFKNYRYGRSDNVFYEKFNAPIETAIKKGLDRLKPSLLRLAETSLGKMIAGYEYEEATIEEKMIIKGYDKLTKKPLYEKIKLQKRVRKHLAPNSTLIMFTAVNCSDGKWVSINRQAETTGNNKIGILENIAKMVK